ncbi:protein kinase [Acanthamoeba castellanii str. Neff]|uniref:Protein kinase n=1 Tax=Acanthamoeba castellanii (strain ATCC 30010 / Neff) TaxID=1257118 RepID=L8H5I8_ACACF|nr:protein kinase [Acanthamoeba castellanii str. Neff]ELR19993.1 protein kinase [Acanthamoeba castellanii str. Neff]
MEGGSSSTGGGGGGGQQQQKGRPVMLLFPGGRSARIPFPRDPDDLGQRILKFAHGAIDPLLLKAYEKDADGFYPQVDLQDFFDIFPDGGVTLYITNGEDFDEELFRKPGSAPQPSGGDQQQTSGQPAASSLGSPSPSGSGAMAAVAVAGEARPGGGGGLVVDEQQLTKLVDQLARNLNRGRDDFWLSSFGSTDCVPWAVFVKGFCAHFQPMYQRLAKPENVQEEIKILLEAEGVVTLQTWQRFTLWSHPIEKVVQIMEDLRDRGLIYHKGFVGFRRQEEEGRLVEDLMARDHSSHGVLLRLSETYAHQHGIWLTIVQRRERRAHPERMNYLLENCPLIYYKLFSGFTIPTYTGNQVFDSVDKLVNYVIVERASTMKEYVTKELREALRSSTRIMPLRHYYYCLKRKESEMREGSSANHHAAKSGGGSILLKLKAIAEAFVNTPPDALHSREIVRQIQKLHLNAAKTATSLERELMIKLLFIISTCSRLEEYKECLEEDDVTEANDDSLNMSSESESEFLSGTSSPAVKRLKLYGLQVQQPTSQEDESLFVSLSIQIWGTVHNATYLRTKVVEWLLDQAPSTKLGEEEVLIEELMAGTDIRQYCDTIDQRPTSGDVLILAAIADVFKRPVMMITSLEGDRHVVQITPRDPITPRPVLIAHVWPHHYQPLAPSPHELEEIEPIGRGAQASVIRGRYKGLPVAIKRVVLTDNADLTEHAFERELTLLQKLHCPALIQFLGACLESPPRLVFEFMSGGSLHDLLHHNLAFREAIAADPKLLVHLALNIATGMQFLHASKITHCDLTPNNILLDEHRKAKVADFGLARLLQAPGHFDQTGHFAYVAPEIWEAKTAAHFSYASDVFSFGMVLWEMWARRVPYEKQYAENVGRGAEVPRAYIADVGTGWRPALPSNVPPAWLELIHLCWHQDPSRRPTFAELASEEGPLRRIERVLGGTVPFPANISPAPAAGGGGDGAFPYTTSPSGTCTGEDANAEAEAEEAIKQLNLRDVY